MNTCFVAVHQNFALHGHCQMLGETQAARNRGLHTSHIFFAHMRNLVPLDLIKKKKKKDSTVRLLRISRQWQHSIKPSTGPLNTGPCVATFVLCPWNQACVRSLGALYAASSGMSRAAPCALEGLFEYGFKYGALHFETHLPHTLLCHPGQIFYHSKTPFACVLNRNLIVPFRGV